MAPNFSTASQHDLPHGSTLTSFVCSTVDQFLAEFAKIQSRYDGASGLDRFDTIGRQRLEQTLRAAIYRREPIQIVLPAFPFKSPGRGIKVLGSLPDRGEELALERLENFCKSIEKVYAPGCTVTIFSDGRVFSDLLGVPDADLKAFKAELRAIATDAGHSHIRFDGLENYATSKEDPIREILVRFGVDKMDMDAKIKADEGLLNTYRCFRKFLKKDLSHTWSTMSSSAASKRMGEIAKLMMHRNVAFSMLVDEVYPCAVRFSIHLYDNAGPKYGIHLLPTSTGVPRTPWHSTICEDLDGTINVVDVASVDKTKYELVSKRGRAWGFVEKQVVQEDEWEAAWKHLDVEFIKLPLALIIKARESDPSRVPPSVMDVPVASLRKLIHEYGVVSLQGFQQLDSDGLEVASARIGDVLQWHWGSVFEIKQVVDTKLSGQTLESMPMHYDGMFKKKTPDATELGDVPLLQLFHCVEAYPDSSEQEDNGRTLFSHSLRILADLSEEERQRLREAKLVYNSGIFGHEQFTHVSPVIINHSVTGHEVLRYHEPWGPERTKMHPTSVNSVGFDRASGLPDTEADWVAQLLVPKLYDPAYCYRHQWTKGEYVVSDNVSLLHTRTAMKADGRHVRRVHIN